MTRTRTAALATGAALLLALAACSSSDSDEDTSGTTAAADVEQALVDYTDALNQGDAQTVYDLNSARCREARTLDEAEQAVDLINELYGDIDYESIDVTDVTEDTAQVNAVTGIDALDNEDSAQWVLEDGAWRNDGC